MNSKSKGVVALRDSETKKIFWCLRVDMGGPLNCYPINDDGSLSTEPIAAKDVYSAEVSPSHRNERRYEIIAVLPDAMFLKSIKVDIASDALHKANAMSNELSLKRYTTQLTEEASRLREQAKEHLDAATQLVAKRTHIIDELGEVKKVAELVSDGKALFTYVDAIHMGCQTPFTWFVPFTMAGDVVPGCRVTAETRFGDQTVTVVRVFTSCSFLDHKPIKGIVKE